MKYIYHIRSEVDGKTLCGRVITQRYNIIDPRVVYNLRSEHGQVMCKHCMKKALKWGIVEHIDNLIPDGFDVSDNQHNDWLSRLGIN